MFIAHGSRIRKYSPWILAGVLVLVLPSFIMLFTPTGRGTADGQVNAPKIDGKRVPADEFIRARNHAILEIMFQYGSQPEILRMAQKQIEERTLQILVLRRKANDLGIRVSNAEIEEQIAQIPQFRNETTGQFDWYRYTGYLQGRNIKAKDFEDYLRGQIMVNQLFQTVTSGIHVTPNQVRSQFDMSYEQYRIELIEFKADDFKDAVTVSDEDAAKHYESKKDQYTTPEQVKVRYALFPVEKAIPQITVSDDDVKKHYEQNASQYVDAEGKQKTLEAVTGKIREELIHARAIRRAGEDATRFLVELHKKAESGAVDFAAIAGAFHATVHTSDFFDMDDPVEGVKAGNRFNRLAFALKKGAGSGELLVSEPVEGEDGVYVIEFLEAKPSEPAPFEKVKADIVAELKSQRAMEKARSSAHEAMTKIKEAMVTGKTYSEAAESLNLKVTKPDLFTGAKPATGIPNAALIQSVARRTQPGAISDMILVSSGAMMFYMTERLPPTDEQFEKEKETVADSLLSRQRSEAWRKWTTDVMATVSRDS